LATFSAAHAMKERMARSVLRKSGVHGIGVGYHDPKNPKKGAAVIIYTDKLTPTSLGLSTKYSMTSNGKAVKVPIRVVKTGKFRCYADYKSKIRPVPAGYSIGTTGGSGTLGLIVTNYPNPRQRYIFSNNHVLNPGNTGGNIETLQPGGADRGQTGRDRIGRLYRYVPFRKQNNLIDAALSIPTRNSLLNPRYATVGVVPGHVTTYRVGERFKKVGRTTGLVTGVVDSVNTDLQINYGGSLGLLSFSNQTIIKGDNPVSLPGDSGSVWLRQVDNYAAAVNYAGSSDGKISISYPVNWFMQRFGTRVARPGGAGGIKTVKANKSNHAYAPQLKAKELASMKIIVPKMIKKKTN
jgi:hypothetical protein